MTTGRSIVPWLLAAPLLVTGSLVVHELSYRIIAPRASSREILLGTTPVRGLARPCVERAPPRVLG